MSLERFYSVRYDYLAVSRKAGRVMKNEGCRAKYVKGYGEGVVDAFQTLNPVRPYNEGKYTAYQRCKGNVCSLKFNYMDIDIRPDENGRRCTPEQIIQLLHEEDVIPGLIPEPTFIVYSGTGFWFLWAINEHIKALPRWERVQQRIYEILKDYGADSSVVTDCARLCRIEGSINSKCGKKVEYVLNNDHVFSLYELLEYIPGQKAEKKTADFKLGHPLSKGFYHKRAMDLAYILRNHRDYTGYRELCLFLFRQTLVWGGMGYKDALEETLKLNASLKNSLSEREVRDTTKSADKKKYKYSNRKIIEVLALTDEELKGLKSIVTDSEKRRRNNERSARNYIRRRKEAGLLPNEQRMRSNEKKIVMYLKKGMSAKQIQDKLGMSKSSFYNYMKRIAEMKHKKYSGMHRMGSETLLNLTKVGSPKKSSPILKVRSTVRGKLTGDDKRNVIISVVGRVSRPKRRWVRRYRLTSADLDSFWSVVSGRGPDATSPNSVLPAESGPSDM